MSVTIDTPVMGIRTETDSLGKVDVPSDKLWGAQTQRSLEHFSIGHDLIPREMISAFANLKKGAANANHNGAGWTTTSTSSFSRRVMRFSLASTRTCFLFTCG
jgi:fumarate hydratase class II